MFPILKICHQRPQIIGDIYHLSIYYLSLVGKIWDSQEAVKCPIVCDFPNIWKPSFIIMIEFVPRS